MRPDGKQIRSRSVPTDRMVKLYAACELGATATVAGTTLADIGLLQFTSLDAFATYYFQFSLGITQASATGIVGVGINFTGSVTRIQYNAVIAATAALAAFRNSVSNNTALTDAAARAIGGPFPTLITGSITTATTGTLSCRAQRSAGTTTVLAGSAGFISQL